MTRETGIVIFSCQTTYNAYVIMSKICMIMEPLNVVPSTQRTGAVVSAPDYGLRDPWFETWPGRSSL